MGYRIGLIALQGLGAVSLLPYPAILVASVMQIAAERPPGALRFLKDASPFALLSLYPLLWILLDLWAWRAFSQGAHTRAFVLSGIPVALSLAAVGAFFSWENSGRKQDQARWQAIQAKVEQANPLTWTMMRVGGPSRWQGTTPISIDDALQAIARADRINVPAPEYGTPLQIALWNLEWNADDTPRPGRVRLVRALLARDARLADDERVLRTVWLLKAALVQAPVNTRQENPLAWRICHDTEGPFVLSRSEYPLLNQPTRLYGSPLFTALLKNRPEVARDLVAAGARLAPDEQREPAALQALAKLPR